MYGWGCAVTVLLLVGAAQGETTDRRQRSVQMTNDELQKKYDTVVKEMGRLQETVDTLKTMCAELGMVEGRSDVGDNVDSGSEDHSAGDGGISRHDNNGGDRGEANGQDIRCGNMSDSVDGRSSPFEITKAEVERFDGEYVFHLEYSTRHPHACPPHAEWFGGEDMQNNSPVTGNNTCHEGKGDIFVTTELNELVVAVLYSPWREVMTLNYTNTTGQQNISSPSLQVNVSGDVVFANGESTFIKVTTPKTGDQTTNQLFYGFTTYNKKASENTAMIINKYEQLPNALKLLKIYEFSEHEETIFQLNSGGDDYEGLFHVAVRRTGDETDIVPSHYKSKIMKVRRSDHSGPFPESSIMFVKQRHNERSCEEGTDCTFQASVVGYDPCDITLWRADPNTVVRRKVNAVSHSTMLENSITTVFKIANITRDAGRRYIFLATGKSDHAAEDTFLLDVFMLVKFVANDSRILEVSLDRLVVQCAAHGYPFSEILFARNGLEYFKDGPGIDIRTYEHGDRKYYNRAVLTIVGPREDLDFVTCSAVSGEYLTDKIRLEIPKH